jgi:hypothetical protein
MSLFGVKCSRCGRRTRHTRNDVPTCELCEQEIETRLKAQTEDLYPCPLCKAAMAKEVVQSIVIDRCPDCQGVWLDKGELDLIKRVVEERAAREILRGMTYPI